MGTLVLGNNGVIASAAADGLSFEDAGFTTNNLLRIKKIGNPTRSFDPAPGKINSFTAFVENAVYEIKMKTAGLVVPSLYPPLPDEAPEIIPAVYQFNGADQVITPANNADLAMNSGTAFSAFLFAKILSSTGATRFGRGTPTQRNWDVNFSGSVGGGGVQHVNVDVQMVDTAGTNYLYFHSATTGGGNEYALNAFHRIWVTYDGSFTDDAVKIYINGVLNTVEENSGIVTALRAGGTFKLGQIGGDPNPYYANNSQIDEFFLANRVITPTEITEHENGGVPKLISECSFYNSTKKLYYRFNHNLNDEVGTHNGTATNPVYI